MTKSIVERTCVLVKPDGVCKNVVGTVLARFAQAGLHLRGLKMLRLSTRQAEDFYGEHKGKPFYAPLIQFMTSAPIVATVWEGDGAIGKARAAMGATNSPEAAPGTLRREFGTNNRYNVVHGSDSATSAEREVRFFFKPDEIYTYQDNDWKV
jgi:nucleoside-diphosphate kinase